MDKNVIKSKTYDFALRIVDLSKFLTSEKKEFVLSKRILRSGTRVGIKVREAEHAETKKDFIDEMEIAQKEINETIYWLELLHASEYVAEEEFKSLNNDAVEIIKIITAIIRTAKSNLNKTTNH